LEPVGQVITVRVEPTTLSIAFCTGSDKVLVLAERFIQSVSASPEFLALTLNTYVVSGVRPDASQLEIFKRQFELDFSISNSDLVHSSRYATVAGFELPFTHPATMLPDATFVTYNPLGGLASVMVLAIFVQSVGSPTEFLARALT
jgi:hypothetical protein